MPVRHVQPLDDRADGEHVHRELPVADDHRTLMAAVAAAAQAERVGLGLSCTVAAAAQVERVGLGRLQVVIEVVDRVRVARTCVPPREQHGAQG